MNTIVHYDIKVQGIVQGVFYRSNTEKVARELGLTGLVRNDSDGSVYIEAEGPMPAVNQLIEWCHEGPKEARVTRVNYAPGRLVGYKEFAAQQ